MKRFARMAPPLIFTLAFAGQAIAEEALEASALEEIVVTAQRRTENLQKAAIAVSVVTPEAIKNAGVTNPGELTKLIPSIQIAGNVGSFSSFYVRGVGNFTGTGIVESAVSFNYDGVVVGRPSATTGFFYDLERIEVLKGPQGTLYGRNATGGAINVLPAKPTFENGGYVTAEVGNYAHKRVDGAVNVALTDSAALRFATIYVKHDGYMNDGTDDQDDLGGRAQFRIDPTDGLSIVWGADYFRQKGNGPGGTPVLLGVDNRYGTFSPEVGQFYLDSPHALVPGNNFQPLPNVQFMRNEFYGTNATVNWNTDFGTFTLIPGYRRSDLDYATGNIGFLIFHKETFKQSTAEARYASPEENRLKVIAGLYYFRERGEDPYHIINNQYAYFNEHDQEFSTTSEAAFSRLVFDVTDSLRLNGGVRYTEDRKVYSGTTLSLTRTCLPTQVNPFPAPTTGSPPCIGAGAGAIPFVNAPVDPTFTLFAFDPTGRFIPPQDVNGVQYPGFAVPANTAFQIGSLVSQSKRETFDKITWRGGIDWDVTPENLLYASYETGYKAGGFYATADAGVFQPETLRALTVGSKNRFLSDTLQVNAEGFYWKYKDQQITHLIFDSSSTLVFGTENAGRSTIKGGEIETKFLVTDLTLLSADVQYLNSVYDDFRYVAPFQAGPPVTGCSAPAGAAGFNVDCSGKTPPQAPKWSINAAVQQSFPVGSGKIVADLSAHFQTETQTSVDFLSEQVQDAVWTEDAQVGYHADEDRWSVSAYINNITDETVMAGTFVTTFTNTPTTPASSSAFLRPPRTFGVRASFNF